jgi:hypothetical protein
VNHTTAQTGKTKTGVIMTAETAARRYILTTNTSQRTTSSSRQVKKPENRMNAKIRSIKPKEETPTNQFHCFLCSSSLTVNYFV